MIALTLGERRKIRALAHAHSTMSITIVSGGVAPTIEGESYYWTWGANPNGTRVWSSRGRGMWRTHYWPSTRQLIVGEGWVAAQRAQSAAAQAQPVATVATLPPRPPRAPREAA